MNDERNIPNEQDKYQKKKKEEGSLPPCTIAPSAEHAGAHHDDAPCDDGREGTLEED